MILISYFIFMPNFSFCQERPNSFSLYFENDVFAHTDQNYTNGVKFSWLSPDFIDYEKSGYFPDWSLPYLKYFSFMNNEGFKHNVGFSLAQKMFTPEDTSENELIENDRPYAGWTYFGTTLHSKTKNNLHSMGIQLGIVGPLSYADETQIFVHQQIGSQRPNGWDNQLENEPGLVVIYEHKTRFIEKETIGGLDFDVIPCFSSALGNIYTYAGIGTECRIGWNIPKDFGTARIRPAEYSGTPIKARKFNFSKTNGLGLYLFTSVTGAAIWRNIFLEGNTFSKSHSVDKNLFVADISAGICVIIHRFKLSYTHIIQTKEFKEQEGNQTFGSIVLSFTY